MGQRVAIWMGVLAVAMLAMGEARAHVGTHPSVHDTVAGILDRLGRTQSTNELKRMKVSEALALITAKEREVLGSEHVLFRVNVPTLVTVAAGLVAWAFFAFWAHGAWIGVKPFGGGG